MALVATTEIRAGQEITVPPHDRLISDLEGHGHLYEVTFDGGADRHTQTAGAAAVLWHRRDIDYAWRPIAGLEISLPTEWSAPTAEAWGAHAALTLLHRERPVGARTATVIGDNLAVVRFGRAQGRLHSPDLQAPIEEALQRTLMAGWLLNWKAVRRRWNKLADFHATRAKLRAAQLKTAGVTDPTWVTIPLSGLGSSGIAGP